MSSKAQDSVKQITSPKHSLSRKEFLQKTVLYLLSMISISFLTFAAVALFSGGPNYFQKTLKNLFTPGTPKIVVQTGNAGKKIKALPANLTKDLVALLNRPTNSPTAMAILEAKQESQIKTILNKISYKPVTIKTNKPLDRSVYFSKEPSQVKVFLNFNGKDILSDSLEALQTFDPATDGPCYVLVDAYWPADKTWKTDRHGVYSFVVNYDRPAEFELNTLQFDPGELMVIYARYLTKEDKIKIKSDLPMSLQFAPYNNDTMVALVPLSYDLPAGNYATMLTVDSQEQSFTITINDKDFPDRLMTKEEELGDLNRQVNSKGIYGELIQPVLEDREAGLLWTGQAIMPVDGGEISTVFGVRCYVEDESSPSTRHTGIDITAEPGTPVKAINNGKVMFAGELPDIGGLVIIEHGLGLKSWYLHLAEINVEVGDMINKGTIIGNVGKTNSAHKNHLHMNLSVNNTFINPETALNYPLFNK